MSRSSRYVGGVVIISRKAAFALEQLADMQSVRTNYRGDDDELYDTFLGIREASLDWADFVQRKANETAAKAEATLGKRYTTAQLADKLHLTSAGVRLAIREGRLQNDGKVDGRWTVTATALEAFQLNRTRRNT